MALSSNSLIHFTNKLANLKGILKDNFKLRYCREIIRSDTKRYDFLVPMVSFCDIPFSQIEKHIQSYGNYGIGLKKSWAEKNGLNPVLYTDINSNLSKNFFDHLLIKIKNGDDDKKISKLTLEEKYVFDIFRYIKNYQGKLERSGKKIIENYRFSDEREWRYVLNLESEALMFANLKKVIHEDVSIFKQLVNDEIENERLNFEPEDINYIIIKNESERNDIIRTLENIKGKYPMEQVKRLTSRIISTEQIKSDF
ncbi:abortive infection system antitoxin AbiGi family protein [Chryseobacterium sp. JM1]|uniref:abortive infection system antitoxin AbiGi family protein n=1 Tax=Chryseobacterium sp. JM1 TaxID=1233950 RepID=UPI00069185EF|nr:abortive infection system antitoxin AbiGi family protein [Chryseobacterium sp. JM1]